MLQSLSKPVCPQRPVFAFKSPFYRLQNWHCLSKRRKGGAQKKAEPPNWPSSLSRKLARPVRRAGHQIYVRATGGEALINIFIK